MINNKLYRDGLNRLNGSNGHHEAFGRHGASGLRGSLSFIIYYLSFIISLTCLVACSSDSDDEMTTSQTTTEKSVPVELANYVTWFDEVMGTQGVKEVKGTDGAYLTTRAWTVPTGYMAYESGVQSIGIAFTQDGVDPAVGTGENPKPMIGTFFFSSGKWRSSVEDIKDATYYLYGYIPYSPGIKYSITDYNGGSTAEEKNAEYSKGAIMKLTNVPTVMSNDLCVVIGAKDGTDKETVTGLRKGDFSVKAEPTSDDNPKNFIFLLFDHLYSALSIRMKVQEKYNELRTIKLDTLMLSTFVDETPSKVHSDITITLTPNDGSTSPITDISYTPTSGDPDNNDGIVFWKAPTSEGVTLTKSFPVDQDFTGHFMPSGINKLVLTSIYDIYDKQGNLLRENCRATNTMELSELIGASEVRPGKKIIVKMTIKPTYLYMLSEPDLENPTVVLEK